MKTTILISLIFGLIINIKAQTVTDFDGNIYNTINIGSQTWMTENLKVTHFNNGESIPLIKTNWNALQSKAYCFYNNDINNIETYGILYNWFTVNYKENVCPIGWHIPDTIEWNILINQLGGQSIAGGKLREAGLIHWTSPNTGATNESGFTALPAGVRDFSGTFQWLGNHCAFATTIGNLYEYEVKTILLENTNITAIVGGFHPNDAISIRCIKDNASGLNNLEESDKKYLYPNPSSEKISIICSKNQTLNVIISNLEGEILIQKNNYEKHNKIDVSSLNQGLYIVNISGNNINFQQKLTIQK